VRTFKRRRYLQTAALLLSILWAVPELSFGHAFPDHADPRVGSTVSASPPFVRIWFDGDLEPVFSTIIVHDAKGNTMDKGNGHVDASDPKLLEVSLPPLQPGTYRVLWNVIARDGHRTQGEFTFTIK
jgi:methionine-rich copper-binding protein CopC